jgi:hypothetical protein
MQNKKKSRRSAFLTLSILDVMGWQVALKIAKNRGNTKKSVSLHKDIRCMQIKSKVDFGQISTLIKYPKF